MDTLNTLFAELNRAYDRFKKEQKKNPAPCADSFRMMVEVLVRSLCKIRTQAYLHGGVSDEALNLSLLHFYSPVGRREARAGTWVFFTRLLGDIVEINTGHPEDFDRLFSLQKELSARSEGDPEAETARWAPGRHEELLLEIMERLGFFRMTLRRGEKKSDSAAGPEGKPENLHLCWDEACFPVRPLFFPNREGLLEELTDPESEGTGSLIRDGRIEKIERVYPRFQAEIQGNFHESLESFLKDYHQTDYRPYPEVREELQRLVEEGRAYIKVIGRPLTGKSSLTVHIDTYIPGAQPFRIDYGLLSHDAGVFEAFVRREIGKILDTPDESDPLRKKESIFSLVKKLEKQKKRLVIAVDNAQLLVLLRPGSHVKIIDLMKNWDLPREGGSPLIFILVTRYASAEHLPGSPVQIPDSYSHIRTEPEKKEALLKIIAEKDRLADPLIAALLAEMEPVPLWRLSEKVEQTWGRPVFIPILKMSLETVLADLIHKNERGWYAIWEELRN